MTTEDFTIESCESILDGEQDVPGPWWCGWNDDRKTYLHRDGVWRRSTAIQVGVDEETGRAKEEYRGYFATESDARAALDAALASGNVPPSNGA